jgi:RHS repeat-associated protein
VIHVVHDPDGNRIAEYLYDDDTGSSTLIRQYLWMEDRPVAVVEGSEIYFIRTDHIGRPVFATNDLGVKVWEASYLPFGVVHVATGGIDLRFPGQWFQAESGLHQNWMRDYDPTTGRYIQADPLGLVDGASVYGYALQNPGRWIDPRGEYIAGPMSPVPNVDNGIEQCVSQICTLQYQEDLDDAKGSGFPGKICHYRCPNGRWFQQTQIGTQNCKPSLIKDAGPLPFSVPPMIGPFAPRLPGGSGGGGRNRPTIFEVPRLISY